MQSTFFLSPKESGKLIWGAGPIFQKPRQRTHFWGRGSWEWGRPLLR